jgi:hypothetical protein
MNIMNAHKGLAGLIKAWANGTVNNYTGTIPRRLTVNEIKHST